MIANTTFHDPELSMIHGYITSDTNPPIPIITTKQAITFFDDDDDLTSAPNTPMVIIVC